MDTVGHRNTGADTGFFRGGAKNQCLHVNNFLALPGPPLKKFCEGQSPRFLKSKHLKAFGTQLFAVKESYSHLTIPSAPAQKHLCAPEFASPLSVQFT